MHQTRGSYTDMKLHEDKHSVASISDVGNNICVGPHKRNVKNHDRKQQQFTLMWRIG